MKAKRKTARTRRLDRDKVQRELAALEYRLRVELQERLSNVQNASHGDPSELLDQASEGELDFMAAASAEAGSATIREIQQALHKLQEGTYGVCDACGKRIKQRRLKARPFATLCIACKEREERFGHPAPALRAHPDAEVTLSLTADDVADEGADGVSEMLRDVEEVEISELY
jgi:DnaK suppressor protein